MRPSTVGNSHEILENDFAIRVIGNIYLCVRLMFTKNAEDASRSSSLQEHKICHPFALRAHCGTFYSGKQSRKLFVYVCFVCANGKVHVPFRFES